MKPSQDESEVGCDDAHGELSENVEQRCRCLSVRQEAQRFVAEGREGRETSENSDGQEEARPQRESSLLEQAETRPMASDPSTLTAKVPQGKPTPS